MGGVGVVDGGFVYWTTYGLGCDKHTFDHVVCLGNLAVCSHHMMWVLRCPRVCRLLPYCAYCFPCVAPTILCYPSPLSAKLSYTLLPKFCVGYVEKLTM